MVYSPHMHREDRPATGFQPTSVAHDVFELLRRARDLGALQTPQAIAELLVLMDHDSPLVRSEAARVLAEVGQALRQNRRLLLTIGQPRSDILTAERLIDDLSIQIARGAERLREAWAESLGQWRHEGAVPALKPLLADLSPRVRAAAAQALGETGDLGALALLQQVIDDADPWVRRNVAAAVGTIGLAEGAPLLKDLRRDETLLVRCAALQALGDVGSSAALAWLHEALEDAVPEARWQAARSLANAGRVSSLPRLERLYDDTSPVCAGTVAQAARQAAQHIREREGSLWSQLLRALLWIGRQARRLAARQR